MGNKKKGNLKRNKRGRPPIHGGFSLLATGDLPENMAHVKKYLSDMRAGLVQDYGPNEDGLSTSQIVIIDRALAKAGVLRCMEEYCRKEGVMKGGNLAHCLRNSYLAYGNSLRLDLQALKDLAGKKGEEDPDLKTYIDKTYGGGKKDE